MAPPPREGAKHREQQRPDHAVVPVKRAKEPNASETSTPHAKTRAGAPGGRWESAGGGKADDVLVILE